VAVVEADSRRRDPGPPTLEKATELGPSGSVNTGITGHLVTAYKAMDERRAIKVLIRIDTKGTGR
jgi:hypothetical protein